MRDGGNYRVFLEKVLHKREDKIQETMKMTSQKDENLVQVQHSFWQKNNFQIMIFLADLATVFECLVLMILRMTRYYEKLPRDSPLSLYP